MQKKNVNKKIKILFQGLSTNLGGIETYLYNLCRNIDRNKFEISFMVFDYGKKVCFEDELINLGAKIYKITPRTKNYFKFKKDLKNLYKNNEFDFIHFNLMDFSCFERITLANKYSKAKIIIQSHTANESLSRKTKVLHTIGKIMIRGIKYYRAACSYKAGKFLFENESFEIFNNGIELEKFEFNQDNRLDIRNELNIPDDCFVMGMVGMFWTPKNHRFLVKLFYEYQKMNYNSRLLLIGEGILMDNIKNLVNSLELQGKVIFLGKRSDTNKIYSAMDTYVVPSLYEGISIALVEAQANGLKCYVSNTVDANSDVTGNIEFLDLTKGAKYWAEYIFYMQNKRLENAVKIIPENYDVKKCYNRVFDFYKLMLE